MFKTTYICSEKNNNIKWKKVDNSMIIIQKAF